MSESKQKCFKCGGDAGDENGCLYWGRYPIGKPVCKPCHDILTEESKEITFLQYELDLRDEQICTRCGALVGSGFQETHKTFHMELKNVRV